jgi:putative hydrolase of the HAD superfamily
MSSAAAAKESDGKKQAMEAGALLFILEGVGSQARQALYDATRAALDDQGVKLTQALFARHGFHPTAEAIASGLADAATGKKINADKLAAAIGSAVSTHIAKLSKLPEGLAKLVDAAVKRDMPVALMTALPEEAAAAALARCGYGDGAIQVFAFPDAVGGGFPRADLWIKIAKQLGKSTRACLVAADDAAACKSALAAGMKCVAVPVALTAHQDFCGADVILDAWDELSAREILDTAIPVK